MNALFKPLELKWRTAELRDVDALLHVEQRAYGHPWTRGNFVDSLNSGHWAWCAEGPEGELCAYWLAMPVLEELHLLNVVVEPAWQGQGLGRQALAHLHEVAAARGMHDIWLEVRESNLRAQQLYRGSGYVAVGRRRGYYPNGSMGREDALLMRRKGESP